MTLHSYEPKVIRGHFYISIEEVCTLKFHYSWDEYSLSGHLKKNYQYVILISRPHLHDGLLCKIRLKFKLFVSSTRNGCTRSSSRICACLLPVQQIVLVSMSCGTSSK